MQKGYAYVSIKEWLNTFASTTAIRGFAFIKQSKTSVEKIIWWLVVLVCIYQTISDLINTVNSFKKEPTSSRFRVMKNESITLLKPKLCFSLDTPKFNTQINMTDMSQVLQLLSKFKPREITNLTNVEENFFQFTLLSAMMIGNLIRAEQQTSSFDNPNRFRWGLIDLESGIFSNSTSLSLATVKDYWVSSSMGLKNLTFHLCAQLCKFIRLKLLQIEVNFVEGLFNNAILDPCEQNNCYYFGSVHLLQREFFCIRIPSDNFFTFHNQFDRVVVTYDMKPLYPAGMKWIETPRTTASFFLGFEGQFGTRNLNVFKVLLNTQMGMVISISSHFHAVNIRRNPCSYKPYFECSVQCRSEYIAQVCGCDPVSDLSYQPRVGVECGSLLSYNRLTVISHLSSAKCANLSVLYPHPNCSDSCHEECETFIIEASILERISDDVKLYVGNQSAVEISMQNYVYPRMEEYLSMTAAQLVVSLGGNLSLYLGASFIGLFHMVMLLFRLPFDLRDGPELQNSIQNHSDRNRITKPPNKIKRHQNYGESKFASEYRSSLRICYTNKNHD